VGMERLAKLATEGGKTNVAFVAHLLTGNVEACAELLISTKRLPEAAFFVRTYLPSKMDQVVELWKKDLASISESAANSLSSPSSNPDLFPDMEIALQVEKMFLAQRENTKETGIPASDYLTAKEDLELNLIELIKAKTQPQATPPVEAGETKEADPADDADAAVDDASEQAAEEAVKLEEEEQAAIEAAKAAAEAEPAAAEEKSADDFGDDW
jgi:coatomer subunit beta'